MPQTPLRKLMILPFTASRQGRGKPRQFIIQWTPLASQSRRLGSCPPCIKSWRCHWLCRWNFLAPPWLYQCYIASAGFLYVSKSSSGLSHLQDRCTWMEMCPWLCFRISTGNLHLSENCIGCMFCVFLQARRANVIMISYSLCCIFSGLGVFSKQSK